MKLQFSLYGLSVNELTRLGELLLSPDLAKRQEGNRRVAKIPHIAVKVEFYVELVLFLIFAGWSCWSLTTTYLPSRENPLWNAICALVILWSLMMAIVIGRYFSRKPSAAVIIENYRQRH